MENRDLREAAYTEALQGIAAHYDKNYEGNDDYTQAGNLFRLITPDKRSLLIHNIVEHMKPVKREIQVRQVRLFYRADPAYGEGVAKGLGIDMNGTLAMPQAVSGRPQEGR